MDSSPFIARYYHFKLPYTSSYVNAFTVVSNTMHIVGMTGCHKKSPRLIKYHRNYLLFDCIATPFILIECVFAWYNSINTLQFDLGDDIPNTSEVDNFFPNPQKLIMYFSLFVGSFAAVAYAQQIYSAYVAYKYEKYLKFHSTDLKEK